MIDFSEKKDFFDGCGTAMVVNVGEINFKLLQHA